jgi:protein-tyrosine phosphatase
MIGGIHFANKEFNLIGNTIKATASIIVPSHYLQIQMPPHIVHKIFPIQDDEDESIHHFFRPTYEFISENLEKGNVLVHC